MSLVQEQKEQPPRHQLIMSNSPQKDALEDPLIKNDIFSRRFDAFRKADAVTREQTDLWTAVFPVERKLIACTDVSPRRPDGSVSKESADGALAKGKELQFLGVLYRECHPPSTRGLVLAILDRSNEQDILEQSRRELAEVTKRNRIGNIETDQQNNQPVELGRMQRFLSAGGLNLLKQWLEDAVATTLNTSNEPEDAPSDYGATLLPLLTVLKDAPFDKSLVMQTKINSRIRKLKKNLDAAVSEKKDDQNLDTYRHPDAGGNLVVEVRQAVEQLMEKWKGAVKISTGFAKDPFAALRKHISERCAVLQKYEQGKILRPTYLQEIEEEDKRQEEKEIRSKLSTQELAARERKQERERSLLALEAKQQETSALLRQKLQQIARKRMANTELKRPTKRTRKVQWRDGMMSDLEKNKHKLEEVFMIPTKIDTQIAEASSTIFTENTEIQAETDTNESFFVDDDDDDDLFT